MPEPKKDEVKAETKVEAKPVPEKDLLPGSESTDGAVQQLLAERAGLVANGQQERADEVSAQLAKLGYR